MITIDTESTIFVDVDDTLVMWNTSKCDKNKLVKIVDPHHPDIVYNLAPHKGHIKVLKDRKIRGSFIVVWSAGGFKWAETVIKALELEKYVDLVLTKPHMYIDDKKVEEFMKEHLYIPYGNGYGE